MGRKKQVGTVIWQQHQFKVPDRLYTDFESVLNPVDEEYRKKMNQIDTEHKGKTSYTEYIKHYVPSGQYVCYKFT